MNAKAKTRAREIAALLRLEPRGFRQGALLAGAHPFTAGDRRNIIAKRNTLRTELYALYDSGV